MVALGCTKGHGYFSARPLDNAQIDTRAFGPADEPATRAVTARRPLDRPASSAAPTQAPRAIDLGPA